ncbi:nicotinate phosphoribosyltransferase [Metarhizobium album]|uniref:Nicotinamide phosphoribosyltransferase n=1 Tax=Metarhizobium album TaxID=2182425 RepID=A0A2U2DSE4_9HYPH|nr:nicotinate phosphoribosyltransferase [Rhizobium album]PWE56218.1 nicotinate phosphoribosyltransferase [Rhizobium album]
MSPVNPILNTDSYKLSHYLQYPGDTRAISSYIEARGLSPRPEVVFFGLQMFLKEYLARPVTKMDILEAAEVSVAHGLPFNREGWLGIVERHGGHMPVAIEALPEGTVVRRGVPMLQIVNTDPACAWVTSYLETALLRAVWYPSSVASNARKLKDMLMPFLERTCEDPAALLPSLLHDFGSRAATSHEQAGLGGAAHLVQFATTDTLAGILYARKYYGARMAGTSFPAAEHATMTSWGQPREAEAYANMIEKFGTGTYSVVSDSYDINNAVAEIWGKQLIDRVRAAGGTLIVRPDSGDPIDTPVRVVAQLAYAFGTHLNAKGFKVINDNVRVLQGDGVSGQDIAMVLGRMEAAGFSAENILFGMGSGLMQKVTRDSYSFTMKASARQDAAGHWHDIAKRPAMMNEKASKSGRLAVTHQLGDLAGIRLDELGRQANSLIPVWKDGELLVDQTFDDIRTRAAEA